MSNFFSISKYLKHNEYLIYLILILIITGPALPDITATILSIVCLFFIIKDKKFNENFYILVIPYIFLILPNLFSPHLPNPLIEQSINLRYVLFSLFIILYYEIKFENLIKFIMIITLFISFDLIFQYIFKFNIFGISIDPSHKQSRASSLFRDELIAGSYIMKLVLPVLGYFFFKKRFVLLIILLIIYEIAIITTGERMSFLLFNFGIVLLSIFHFKKENFKFFVLEALLIILISVSSFIIFDGVKHRIYTTLNTFYINIDGTIKRENLSINNSEHMAHYIIGYNIFKENKIFGTGHKTFRIECIEKEYLIKTSSENKGCSTHPHNIYIELLSDSGLIGLLSFISFVSLIIIKAIKNKIYQSKASGFFVSFIIIVWPISSAGNFFNNRNAIMNFTIIGILLYFCYKDLFNLTNKNNLNSNNKIKKAK